MVDPSTGLCWHVHNWARGEGVTGQVVPGYVVPGEELGSNGAVCAKGEYIELASIFGCTLSAEANIYILGSDAGGNCEGKLSNSAIILTGKNPDLKVSPPGTPRLRCWRTTRGTWMKNSRSGPRTSTVMITVSCWRRLSR